MKLLCLDTSSPAPSVAIAHDGKLLAEVGAAPARGGADRVLALAESALAAAHLALRDCDAIVVARGPGSLTGLRVGIGTARGLAIGARRTLHGVSTLRAIAAQQAFDEPGRPPGGPVNEAPPIPILAILDAGRGEIFAGLFEPGAAPRPLGPELVASPRDLAEALAGRDVRILGPAADRYGSELAGPGRTVAVGALHLAPAVARIAEALLAGHRPAGPSEDRDPALDPAPCYLRRAGAGPLRLAW